MLAANQEDIDGWYDLADHFVWKNNAVAYRSYGKADPMLLIHGLADV